jgi:hypothetical protein
MHRWPLSVLLLVSCKSPDASQTNAPPSASAPAPAAKPSADPNDVFAQYPGSAELCNQLIINEGKPLHWRSWTSADDWSKVTDHYKTRAPGVPTTQGTDRIEFHSGKDRVLMIYPAAVASSHPQCKKPLDPADKTVIMLSEMKMP